MIKNRKKKGFTLIEMVAVVAIIGILAAILVPKITGYMKEAKKTGVIDQARKVTQAYETAKMKDKLGAIDDTKALSELENATILSLLDVSAANKIAGDGNILDKLKDTTTVKECIDIVEGGEFTVNDKGVYQNDVTPVSK